MCTVHTVKLEVNQCICVNVHTGIFTVYQYFYDDTYTVYSYYTCWFSGPV